MANELVIKNGFISQGNSIINGTLSANTLYVNGQIVTGSTSPNTSSGVQINDLFSYQFLLMGA